MSQKSGHRCTEGAVPIPDGVRIRGVAIGKTDSYIYSWTLGALARCSLREYRIATGDSVYLFSATAEKCHAAVSDLIQSNLEEMAEEEGFSIVRTLKPLRIS